MYLQAVTNNVWGTWFWLWSHGQQPALKINPKDKSVFSRIPTLIHHRLPRFNALPVLPLGKLLKRLGAQVEVNQRGLCILQRWGQLFCLVHAAEPCTRSHDVHVRACQIAFLFFYCWVLNDGYTCRAGYCLLVVGTYSTWNMYNGLVVSKGTSAFLLWPLSGYILVAQVSWSDMILTLPVVWSHGNYFATNSTCSKIFNDDQDHENVTQQKFYPKNVFNTKITPSKVHVWWRCKVLHVLLK